MQHHSISRVTQETPQRPDFPASSPDPLTPDPYVVRRTLRELDDVPRAELPNGGAREALAEAIRAGVVDRIYRPLGADYHNLTLTICEADVDPCRTIAEWRAAYTISRKWHSAAMALWTHDDLTARMEARRDGKA